MKVPGLKKDYSNDKKPLMEADQWEGSIKHAFSCLDPTKIEIISVVAEI